MCCVNVWGFLLFVFVKYCKWTLLYYIPSLCLTEPVLPPLLTPFSNNAICTFSMNKCTVNSKIPDQNTHDTHVHTHTYIRVPWCAKLNVYWRLLTNWTYSSCVLIKKKCHNLCFYALLYYLPWCVTVLPSHFLQCLCIERFLFCTCLFPSWLKKNHFQHKATVFTYAYHTPYF